MIAGRIHSNEAIAVDIPLSRNFGGSTYSVLKRSTVVTRLRTADDLVGQVYNGDNRAHGPEIAHLVRDVLAPLVAGLSIMEGERIWERCFALTHAAGMSRPLSQGQVPREDPRARRAKSENGFYVIYARARGTLAGNRGWPGASKRPSGA